MSTQPEALRLANWLDGHSNGPLDNKRNAAAELRRLYAEVERLKHYIPAAPVPVFKPCSCRWKGETQVQQCTLHAAHVEAIHEWAARAKAAEARLKEKNK